jgi:transketolase
MRAEKTTLVGMRGALADELVRLAEQEPRLVVLTADLGLITEVARFREVYPARYFDVGIAEQNMASVAAGLAIGGHLPVLCTFATYLSMRAHEQVRSQIAYGGLRAVLLGYHAGVSAGQNGATHQAIEDLATFRAVPGMNVWAPADASEARAALRQAIRAEGPSYIRVSRPPWPLLDVDAAMAGAPEKRLRAGGDVTIATTGVMAHPALEAAERLAANGLHADVIHLSRLCPYEGALLESSVRTTGKLVTAEEHLFAGGFGEMITNRLHAADVRFRSHPIGLDAVFGESGLHLDLFTRYGLSGGAIAAAAEALTRRQPNERGADERRSRMLAS